MIGKYKVYIFNNVTDIGIIGTPKLYMINDDWLMHNWLIAIDENRKIIQQLCLDFL